MSKQRFDTGSDEYDVAIARGAVILIVTAIIALTTWLWKVAHR